jgi:hypothetical protein
MSKASNHAPVRRDVSSGFTDHSLLVKNLRLLNLDEEFDWPKLTPETFSAKDSVQHQSQRVRAAEWILFKLFQIWDGSETSKVTFKC